MVAPVMSNWDNDDKSKWLIFSDVNGLFVNGSGQVDGLGLSWWDCDSSDKKDTVTFHACNNLHLSGLNFVNSPKNHISINTCEGATISNINITAPDDSPNTDGIDISDSAHVQIHDSFIGTGDDCIAINDGCSFINITNVACGPGHGISVGSLGANEEHNTVEHIHVKNCNFTRTQNGVRIKTWPGGSGYARNITFEQITLDNVDNPIIIDQYYCNGHDNCENKTSNVQVSGVTYNRVHGTSSNPTPINLSCSTTVPCTNMLMSEIDIKQVNQEQKNQATCINAHGISMNTSPAVPCLGK
ncbi:hypothetical protein IFM89_026143 [Coptis chinensis]|uniref:Polygalacturonase n=1 Tax=Coptis chinensis TaxID=261450 RepID=A0A835M130_9MAGN|nr:hypothetical protein IFM89_026143 [Coptis chinensis]